MPQPEVLIVFDVETYYDKEYSLKKMPTPNYILDPRFEMQIVAVSVDNGPHEIVDGPDFGKWLQQYDPANTVTVSYNSLFDNSILAWKYGFVPKTMIDVLGMARALLGHKLTNLSLENVAAHLGLGKKGHALAAMMGKSLQQIKDEGLYPDFCQYAVQDNYLCQMILRQLYPQFPPSERRIMDLVLRDAVEPRFEVNKQLLHDHLIEVKAAKAQLLADAGNIDPKTIMSSDKFKQALLDKGITVEHKISPTTGKETPCFAKTDEFMQELQEHIDPEIAAMAAARIGLKSTLEETRTEKLLSIANLDWSIWAKHVGKPLDTAFMPIPLRYGGAHTHRLSGEWGMNMQNMPTVRGSKGKSKLRQSLICGPDETVVTCDLSQIEARLVAWIAGCTKLVTEFANEQDPYSLLATEIFGYPVNRKLKDAQGKATFEIEGFIGKTGILGLGYGCGKDNFDTMVTRSARSMGLSLQGKYDRSIGDTAVDAYRRRYRQIPQAWRTLDAALATSWLSSQTQKFGPVEIGYGHVKLPSGLCLNYENPHTVFNQGTGRTEFRYRYGKFSHTLYGAKLLENIVQALARIVVMNAALRIRDRGFGTISPTDYRFRLQAHDELVFIVKNAHLDEAKAVILQEMTRRPSWAPTAPINAELGEGASYGEAK